MTVNVGIFGQSISQFLALYNALASFKRCFTDQGDTANVTSFCIGGSAVIKEHAPPTPLDGAWPGPQRYWAEKVGANWVDGPCLTAAAEAIAAAPAVNKPITKTIWMCGESSSVMPVEQIDTAKFIEGYLYVVQRLRQICYPAAPGAVAVLHQPVGRRIQTGDTPGVQVIREAQLAAEAQDGLLFFLCDIYDLMLRGDDLYFYPDAFIDSHLHAAADSELGFRAAQRILQSVLKPYWTAPQVTGITRIDANTLSLPITLSHPGNLLHKPSVPSHLAVRIPAGTVTESNNLVFDWTANSLIVHRPSGIPTGSKVLGPYGDLRVIDRTNLIRDLRGTPLRSFAVAAPA